MSPYALVSKPCRRVGCAGRVTRPDAVYCGRRCGFIDRQPRQRPTMVPKSEPESVTWWLGKSPAEFYATARERHPILAAKYGSTPVSTVGPIEPGFTERGRRAKAAKREGIAD